jgi:hypothetical protein
MTWQLAGTMNLTGDNEIRMKASCRGDYWGNIEVG